MTDTGTIISIANQKGGVGKTTTTLNLGMELGAENRVLLIDLDPQASLTIHMGYEPTELDKTAYDLLHGDTDCIIKGKVDLIPSSIDLANAELELVNTMYRETILRDGTKGYDYDYILIDCPPSLGLLTVNALIASTHVIIPMNCELLAFRGYQLLSDTIKSVQKANKDIDIMGILPTMYDGRTLHHREVLELIKKEPHFETIIKKSIRFPDSAVAAVPVATVDETLGELYATLAEEVRNYVKT